MRDGVHSSVDAGTPGSYNALSTLFQWIWSSHNVNNIIRRLFLEQEEEKKSTNGFGNSDKEIFFE